MIDNFWGYFAPSIISVRRAAADWGSSAKVTALTMAAYKGHCEIVRHLLTHADIRGVDTALESAVGNGYTVCATHIRHW